MPSALYLLACGVVLSLVLVGVGWTLARLLSDDSLGRADAGVSRWLAGERTPGLNQVTTYTNTTWGMTCVKPPGFARYKAIWQWLRQEYGLAIA